MTRSLLGLAALFALPAWAQEPAAEALTPYETVVERPLGATAPVSSSSLDVAEASGQSAVAPAAGASEVAAYGAAMSNAQRSAQADPTPGLKEPSVVAGSPHSIVVPAARQPVSESPWAQAVAVQPVSGSSSRAAKPAVPGEPSPLGKAGPEATSTLASPVPPPPVAAPVASPPLAVSLDTSSRQARPFTAPGDVQYASPTQQSAAVTTEFQSAPGGSVAKPSGSVPREQARRERREQRTVFGPRRHTGFVGLYGGGSLGAPGFGGPSSGALEIGALIGGSLRLGAEFRGLSYGRSGPDVRLASSGFVIGWAFKTRAIVHPTADVVLGAGLVSHQNGDVIGGVGVTALRGGAELNLTRSVRLTASVGWRGIAASNSDVRRDLNGLEGLVGVRVGWF